MTANTGVLLGAGHSFGIAKPPLWFVWESAIRRLSLQINQSEIFLDFTHCFFSSLFFQSAGIRDFFRGAYITLPLKKPDFLAPSEFRSAVFGSEKNFARSSI